MDHVRAVATHFGNTITSTLWRVVENSPHLMFGLIGEHPRYPKDGEAEIAYFIRSRQFERTFPHVIEADLFANLKTFCKYNKTGPLGSGELVLSNAAGERFVFVVESFCNKHHTLTLGRLYASKVSCAA
jgi:hypothetical protein